MEKNTIEKPLVSIVMPSYNSSRFIKESIESVKSQSYGHWELLIIDDCSTDNTVHIIKNEILLDMRINLFVLEQNSGAAVARNKAINLAKGKYIAFLDSDDLWLPQKLEIQVNYMISRDVAFTFTKYRIMKEDGTITDTEIDIPTEINYQLLLKNTIIGCLTVMLDKEKIGTIQMPNIRAKQDTALWLSILKKNNIAYGIQEVLSHYRKVNGSISSNKIRAFRNMWRLYRDIEHLNFFYAIWCILNYSWNATIKLLK